MATTGAMGMDRGRWRLGAAVVGSGLLLGGCAGDAEVTLAEPLTFAPVEDAAGPDCDEGYVPDLNHSECFALAEGFEVSAVQSIELGSRANDEGQATDETVVTIALLPEDAAAFTDLTEALVAADDQERLAMVVAGEVVSAPVVAERIPTGELAISGWNEAHARAFVDGAG
ncbi:hypothetical protein IM660_16480 [Ruania alkalisoli]|uniref:SecDF P1 head subdomain domain-containing protein n=1 Tax=Ruania alkalisoli TaxID=2779775 RepID=A0A7M1SRJ5_9MICO|nr:hypothetical protein [Ruania alkalisoli]QOR70190.1 hypothetical protein IM660_16480 [Ruania alkalisoli]